jgi:hypothetical protein
MAQFAISGDGDGAVRQGRRRVGMIRPASAAADPSRRLARTNSVEYRRR